jgi:hypothetical protein
LAAFQFQFERFLEPTLTLGSGTTSAELLGWAAVFDLFGYYLATAVLAYVLWRQLRPRNPLIADLSTTAALGYALAGGAGAAILAMVAPMLMRAYIDATAAGKALIAAQFATVLQVVWRAIWQFLDAILLAAWWLGIGLLLRQDHPRVSRLSLALAAAAATDAAANIAGLNLVRDVLLGVLFTLWTAWWISLLWCSHANHQQLPRLSHHDGRHPGRFPSRQSRMINNRGGVGSLPGTVESARTHSFGHRCQAVDIAESGLTRIP